MERFSLQLGNFKKKNLGQLEKMSSPFARSQLEINHDTYWEINEFEDTIAKIRLLNDDCTLRRTIKELMVRKRTRLVLCAK